MSIPADAYCDHSPSTNPRARGSCIKCGRKILPIACLSVGEGIELLNLLHRNPAIWNRKLRAILIAQLGEQNLC